MEGKYLQQFKKGSLEMILLCLIAQKETYGYELLTQLNEHGAGVLGLCPGGYDLPHPLPPAGAGPGTKPPVQGKGQWRHKEVLLPDPERERDSGGAGGVLGGLCPMR